MADDDDDEEEPYALFLVDESLNDVERCTTYCASDLPLQRLIYLQRLTTTGRDVGVDECLRRLLPLADTLARDDEAVIREALGHELALLTLMLSHPLSPELEAEDVQLRDLPALYEPPQPVGADGNPLMAPGGAGASLTVQVLPAVDVDAMCDRARTGTEGAASSSSSSSPPPELGPRHKQGHQACLDRLLPVCRTLLTDADEDVRRAACAGLVMMGRLTSGADVERHIVPFVRSLCSDAQATRRRDAATLVTHLARHQPALFSTWLELFLPFCKDAEYSVRKLAAQGAGVMMHNACQTGSASGKAAAAAEKKATKVVAKAAAALAGASSGDGSGGIAGGYVHRGVLGADDPLVRAFVGLSKDPIWSVRKACVEALVAVSAALEPKAQADVVVPLCTRLLTKDPSRWVRNACYEVLGPLIYTLGSDKVTPDFLKHFTSIPTLATGVIDEEVRYFGAFNFPCVALTLGRKRWPELAPHFHVRQTLAHSLCELGHIIGPDMAAVHVQPHMEAFVGDIDEVRAGAIARIGPTIAVFPPKKREELLSFLMQIYEEVKPNWRFRLLLAQQLPVLSRLFCPSSTAIHIVEMALHLVGDKAYVVRGAAVDNIGVLWQRLSVDRADGDPASERAYRSMTALLHGLARADTYMGRQLFIRCCDKARLRLDWEGRSRLVLGTVDDAMFERECLHELYRLRHDRVVNVQIALAKLVHRLRQHNQGRWHKHPKVAAILEVLLHKTDRDVHWFARHDGTTGGKSLFDDGWEAKRLAKRKLGAAKLPDLTDDELDALEERERKAEEKLLKELQAIVKAAPASELAEDAAAEGGEGDAESAAVRAGLQGVQGRAIAHRESQAKRDSDARKAQQQTSTPALDDGEEAMRQRALSKGESSRRRTARPADLAEIASLSSSSSSSASASSPPAGSAARPGDLSPAPATRGAAAAGGAGVSRKGVRAARVATGALQVDDILQKLREDTGKAGKGEAEDNSSEAPGRKESAGESRRATAMPSDIAELVREHGKSQTEKR